MNGNRATVPARDRRPAFLPLVAVVGVAITLVGGVGLVVQALDGNRTVGAQLQAKSVHDAELDDAFYHCLDVQARSLISPDQPVTLGADNLGDLVTLLKGVGSWVTIADPPSGAVAVLSLRQAADTSDACLGTVVVATYRTPHVGSTTRVGTGAAVPGEGPPPAPPL